MVIVVFGDLFFRFFIFWFFWWGEVVVGIRRIVVSVIFYYIGVIKFVEVFSLDKNKIIFNVRYYLK